MNIEEHQIVADELDEMGHSEIAALIRSSVLKYERPKQLEVMQHITNYKGPYYQEYLDKIKEDLTREMLMKVFELLVNEGKVTFKLVGFTTDKCNHGPCMHEISLTIEYKLGSNIYPW